MKNSTTYLVLFSLCVLPALVHSACYTLDFESLANGYTLATHNFSATESATFGSFYNGGTGEISSALTVISTTGATVFSEHRLWDFSDSSLAADETTVGMADDIHHSGTPTYSNGALDLPADDGLRFYPQTVPGTYVEQSYTLTLRMSAGAGLNNWNSVVFFTDLGTDYALYVRSTREFSLWISGTGAINNETPEPALLGTDVMETLVVTRDSTALVVTIDGAEAGRWSAGTLAHTRTDLATDGSVPVWLFKDNNSEEAPFSVEFVEFDRVYTSPDFDYCTGQACAAVVGTRYAVDPLDSSGHDRFYMTFSPPANRVDVGLIDLDSAVATATAYSNADLTGSTGTQQATGAGTGRQDLFSISAASISSFGIVTDVDDTSMAIDNVYICFDGAEAGSTVNPLQCAVDGDNDRIFYRGSQAATCNGTPTTANSCYYSTQHLDVQNPVRMRTTADGDVTDVTRIENDKLHLAFDLPTKYYDHELRFPDQDGTDCNGWTLDKTVVHDASGQYDNGCYTTYVYTRDWTNAYNSVDPICGFTRDDTDASFIELELNWGVHAWEDLENVRDTAVRRNQTWLMPLIVRFPKQVTATTTSIEAFSPVNLIPLLTAQSVVIDESGPTVTLTVDLLTEVQDPFRLESITMDSIPADTTLVTDLTNDTPARVDAECTNSNANCANTWRLSFTSQDTEAPCNFNGAYTFSFTITCSNDLTNCPVDSSTNSATVVFNLATSDHCPTVIADVDLAASMQIFQEATHENLKDDFLDTQVAYFLADVSSTQVALDETEFYSITLDRPVSADVALLDKAQTGTLDFAAGVDNQGDYNLRHDVGGAANAGASSHPTFHFTILTDASHLNLGNDDSEVITVRAVIDVRYPNLSKRVSMTTLNQASQQHSASASMNAGVTSNSGNGASTASSSSTMFGMNVMVVYAGAAVVALVAVAAIVVSMRRGGSNRSQMEKMESTAELTTTTSAV